MSKYTFTVIVEGADLHSEEVVDALFEAGCDEALVGSSDGVDYLDFDREAVSLKDAARSAVADIESVNGLTALHIADSESFHAPS